MADKPRVRAPKQRATPRPDDPSRNRRLLMYGAGALIALAAVAAAVFLVGFGGNDASPEKVRADLEAAGCTLQAVKAQRGQHSLGPDETADWNTDPPTSGPHFGFDDAGNLGTVIWGAYEEPLQLARVVHNLEHGGIYIFYGDDVPDAVVAVLRAFYDDHEQGTLAGSLAEPRRPDRARGLGLGRRRGDGLPGEVLNIRRGGVLRLLQRVPVQGPGAVPGELAAPGQQLEA